MDAASLFDPVTVAVIGGQVIFKGDCFEGFSRLPDASIDLIVTSPPYNLGGFHSDSLKRAYAGYDDKMDEKEYRSFISRAIKECFRVLKGTGSFFLNMKPRIADGVAILPSWVLEGNPFSLKQEIVWNYPSTANVDKVRFYPLHEQVYWFVKKTKGFTFNEEWAIIGDVWYISHITDRNETKVENGTKHPAPFPTQLAETPILACSKKGDVVLDPFVGSGTTLKVCKRHGRVGIGFEKYYADYEKIILSRIQSNSFLPSLLDAKLSKKRKGSQEKLF